MDKQRILIIEDSALTSRLLRAALEEITDDIELAHDGQDGLTALRANPPDLMILDLWLPTLDGWSVLEHTRSDPRSTNIPVIVITGFGGESNRVRAHEAGANAFLAKPFSRTELISATRRLLAGV
ncbi:MAG: response regulator [Acidimicrobiia bacterium]|nr:response regulator [Acidimicrobiia bacterium]